MGYATRMVAKAIFGTPPTSTYEQALHCFLRAEEIEVILYYFFYNSFALQPGFYSTNTYYIGEVYERLGKGTEALQEYKASFRAPVITADDKTIHFKVNYFYSFNFYQF